MPRTVTHKQIQDWLDGVTTSPDDAVKKAKLKNPLLPR
jgi:hypothetical protein